MGHHDNRRTQAFAQFQDEFVQPAGADGIESGRGFVKEQDIGIQRHGARQSGAFLHAAADLGGVELLETCQPHQRQLERDDLADLGRAEFRVFAQRQSDVFRQRHGTPQGAALEQHAETAFQGFLFFRFCLPEAEAVEVHLPLGGRLEADEMAQQRAFAATAAAHDDEDVAAMHREVQVMLDHEVAVGHGEVPHRDVSFRLDLRLRSGVMSDAQLVVNDRKQRVPP